MIEDMNMKEDKYIKKVASKPLFRVMAWICLVIILILIIFTSITGITGSKYFVGCLCLCMIIPFLMYVFLWIGKLLSDSNDDSNKVFIDEDNKK